MGLWTATVLSSFFCILIFHLDVDECSRNSTLCGPNSVCTNIPGKYSCSCLPGFFSPGVWSPEKPEAFKCAGNSSSHFGDFSVGVKLPWNMVTYKNSHLFFLKKYLFIWVLWVLSWYMGSFVGACRLSCSMAFENLVPQPRIEPMSPVLEDRSLTTGPLGKSPVTCLCPWFCGLTIQFLGGPTMVGRSKITLLTWLVVGNGLWLGVQLALQFSLWTFPHGCLGFLRALQLAQKLSEGRWLYGQGSSTLVLLTLGAG